MAQNGGAKHEVDIGQGKVVRAGIGQFFDKVAGLVSKISNRAGEKRNRMIGILAVIDAMGGKQLAQILKGRGDSMRRYWLFQLPTVGIGQFDNFDIRLFRKLEARGRRPEVCGRSRFLNPEP